MSQGNLEDMLFLTPPVDSMLEEERYMKRRLIRKRTTYVYMRCIAASVISVRFLKIHLRRQTLNCGNGGEQLEGYDETVNFRLIYTGFP